MCVGVNVHRFVCRGTELRASLNVLMAPVIVITCEVLFVRRLSKLRGEHEKRYILNRKSKLLFHLPVRSASFRVLLAKGALPVPLAQLACRVDLVLRVPRVPPARKEPL